MERIIPNFTRKISSGVENQCIVFILNFQLSYSYIHHCKHRVEIAVGSLRSGIYALLASLPQIAKVAISLSISPVLSLSLC